MMNPMSTAPSFWRLGTPTGALRTAWGLSSSSPIGCRLVTTTTVTRRTPSSPTSTRTSDSTRSVNSLMRFHHHPNHLSTASRYLTTATHRSSSASLQRSVSLLGHVSAATRGTATIRNALRRDLSLYTRRNLQSSHLTKLPTRRQQQHQSRQHAGPRRPLSTSSPTKNNITTTEVSELRQELKELKELIKAQRSQSYHVESLTRAVSAQTKLLDTRLVEIEHHVGQIRAVHTLLKSLRDFIQHNPIYKQLLKQLETVAKLVGVNSQPGSVVRVLREHYQIAVTVTLLIAALVWNYRASVVYERTSEEVAHLARKTLEQESLRASIQETLQVIVNHPQTLKLLNDLVQQLITHPQTQQDLVRLLVHAIGTEDVQKALLNLLQVVFRDEHLQQLTGEFLLKGLDTKSVKEMLDAQTAELIRGTVSDVSVQQATAAGVQRSLWYAVTPPFLWQLMEQQRRRETQQQQRHHDQGKKEPKKQNATTNKEGATTTREQKEEFNYFNSNDKNNNPT